MESDKILKVGKRLISFLEESLDKGKPIHDNRVYDKVQSHIDMLSSNWNTKEAERLGTLQMNYLVRLYESQNC